MLRVLSAAWAILGLALVTGCLVMQPAVAQDQLPPQLANDPVAKALGPTVINAALKRAPSISTPEPRPAISSRTAARQSSRTVSVSKSSR